MLDCTFNSVSRTFTYNLPINTVILFPNDKQTKQICKSFLSLKPVQFCDNDARCHFGKSRRFLWESFAPTSNRQILWRTWRFLPSVWCLFSSLRPPQYLNTAPPRAVRLHSGKTLGMVIWINKYCMWRILFILIKYSHHSSFK